jgi:hypothetical protein
MRRNPSSIFALPTGTGINRPMGIATLNLILQKLPAVAVIHSVYLRPKDHAARLPGG